MNETSNVPDGTLARPIRRFQSIKREPGTSDSTLMGLMRRLLAVAVVAAGLVAAPAASEIYRWTDRDGKVHFTQDLSKVPSSQRPGSARAPGGARRPTYNRISSDRKVSPAALDHPPKSLVTTRHRGPIHLPYESRGGAMFVMVRLNDLVTAPFIVDTGASDVSIPAEVAARAGIRVGPDTPRLAYRTANGVVSSPVVTLDAVQVGEARVEGVRGSISQSMDVGLLGGSFFNNFTFQIDPAANLITLIRNDRIRSGLSETDWRGRFRELGSKLRTLELYIERNHFARDSRREELEERLEALRGHMERLETEADRADVPQAWRDG